jgi:hypothetical protein
MSYYEDRIKALEARIEEMAMLNRMKAVPVEAKLMDRIGELNAENARLKAEVERLTKAVMHSPAAQLKLKELEGKTTFEEINPKDDNSNINTELLALSNRQASDIRRLTKAGDAMAEEIALAKRQDEGSRFDPIEMHYDHELIVKWNAAKEGKQS